MGELWSRRTVLTRGGALGLASILPPAVLAACTNDAARPTAPTTTTPDGTTEVAEGPWWDGRRSFTEHEAAVVEAATARLIPGPTDDPAEAGSPGAREANVTRYIDTLLSALTLAPDVVFTGGPTSDRAGADDNAMAVPTGLTTVQHEVWAQRLARVREQYTAGVVALDEATGGSFIDATPEAQDAALVANPADFTDLLFVHAIEGMYSAPEYGGNAGGVGWASISFAGDSQPNGYERAAVSNSDGPDVYVRAGIADKLLTLIAASGVG